VDAVTVLSNKPQNPNGLHMGDFLALSDVARNKVIGLSTLSVYYRQAKDGDLKSLIKIGVYTNIANHVNAIQDLFKKNGFDFPSEINWKKKFSNDSTFIVPLTMLDDQEITVSLREILRLTLSLETEALRNATDANVRKLITGILSDDNKSFDMILQLQRDRKWSDFSPVVLPQ
jgi:hypothetical protein